MNDAPFLINGVLRFTGEVPDDARTQSERPGKLQRFVRLSDQRISIVVYPDRRVWETPLYARK